MFDPLALERSKIRAEIKKHEATMAAAEHEILDGSMRMQSLTPGVLAPVSKSGGMSFGWVLLIAAIGAALYIGAHG